MGSLLFLSRPMGASIVRFAYGVAVVILIAYVINDIVASMVLDPSEFVSMMLIDLGILVCGFIAIRALAEVGIAHIEIRDKLGAIERNTMR